MARGSNRIVCIRLPPYRPARNRWRSSGRLPELDARWESQQPSKAWRLQTSSRLSRPKASMRRKVTSSHVPCPLHSYRSLCSHGWTKLHRSHSRPVCRGRLPVRPCSYWQLEKPPLLLRQQGGFAPERSNSRGHSTIVNPSRAATENWPHGWLAAGEETGSRVGYPPPATSSRRHDTKVVNLSDI